MGLFNKKPMGISEKIDDLEKSLDSDFQLLEEVSSRVRCNLEELYSLNLYNGYAKDKYTYYQGKEFDMDCIYNEILRGINLNQEAVMVNHPMILVDYDNENNIPYERLVEKSQNSLGKYGKQYIECECGRYVSKKSPLCTCGKEFKID